MMKKASTYNVYQTPNSLLTTTHIVGYRHTLPVNSDKWLIAEAIDFQEGICMETQLTQSEFKAILTYHLQLDYNKVHEQCP